MLPLLAQLMLLHVGVPEVTGLGAVVIVPPVGIGVADPGRIICLKIERICEKSDRICVKSVLTICEISWRTF